MVACLVEIIRKYDVCSFISCEEEGWMSLVLNVECRDNDAKNNTVDVGTIQRQPNGG